MQTLHRVRSRLVGARRTLLNRLRAIVSEPAHAFAPARRKLELAVDAILADPDYPIGSRTRQMVAETRAEWLASTSGSIHSTASSSRSPSRRSDPPTCDLPGHRRAQRHRTGCGDRRRAAFRRGRDLGAWLGLVPKQHTTGGKPRLLGISKRGNTYLRTLFIHGARAAMPSLSKSQSPLGEWLRGILVRSHRNVVLVALANKLARIAWATLRRERSFELGHVAVAR
jgi:hypothetical protein